MLNLASRTWKAVVACLVVAAGLVVGGSAANAVTLRPAGVIYRSAADGLLWEWAPGAPPVMAANGLGVSPGTQPVEAALTTGGRVIAFHAWGVDTLWWVDANNVGHDTGIRMWPGTSPAIAAGVNGTWMIAFEADTSRMWTLDSTGALVQTPSAMLNGPNQASLVGLSDGSFEMAFLASDASLWVANSVGGGHGTGLFPASSPAIAAHGTSWLVDFQSSSHFLWRLDPAGNVVGTPSAMDPASSPSLTALPDGTYEEAFVAVNHILWVGNTAAGGHGTGNGVATGTSPSIVTAAASTHVLYQVAFQNDIHDVTILYGTDATTDTHLAAAPGNSPYLGASLDSVLVLAPYSGIAPATVDSVQVTGTSVKVNWTDHANNEETYRVLRRDPAAGGLPHTLTELPSRNQSGTGDTYSYTDTVAAGVRACYTVLDTNRPGAVNYSNEVCTSQPALPTPPAAGTGIISVPDSSANIGQQSAVAIGTDGLPILSYYKADTKDLRVAHCANATCTTVTTHDIDTAGTVGMHSSIKIGGDGLPLISYLSQSDAQGHATNDLKVAHCADITCTTATVTTLDSATYVDNDTSLAIGPDGFGIIAYTGDGPGPKTLYAHCLDKNCSSASIRLIDTSGGVNLLQGTVAVAAAPSGAIYIAYLQAAGALSVATCADVNCSTIVAETAVDTSSAGYTPSIAIGLDGLPLISYTTNYGSSFSDQAVAHCTNVYCTSVTRALTHSGDFNGWYGRIAIGADGLGVVAYTNYTNWNVEVGHCADLTCTSLSRNLIDEFDQQGTAVDSIAIGTDGLPVVSYYDLTDQTLRVAHCGDPACANPLIAPF